MSGDIQKDDGCDVLFPHLEGIDNNKMGKMFNKASGMKDDVTFVYTTKFSNLCNDNNKDGNRCKDGNERKKIKEKKEKKKTLHLHKKSCALPGVPTFEDFFGENIGNTSKCMAPHLRKRINEIIVRKNENECFNLNDNNNNVNNNNNQREYTNIKEHKYNSNNEQRIRKDNSMNHIKSKPKDAIVRMKEMETFLGKHFPSKNSHSHNYNSNNNNNNSNSNSNNNGLSKLKAPINTKCKYIQEVNPHVNMYDDVRLLGKSTSCQKIDHLNRLINVQWKNGVPFQQHNEYSSSYHNTNTTSNGLNDLFYVTRDRRIKNKINDLTKFTIFPDYNVRKIDVDLKRQYAKNNLNIIGGIKDQFEENKKIDLKEHQAKLEAFQQNSEIPHPELDEDIDIDHLL